MTISVIISNFNGEVYLEKLLASLQAQKGVTLEIIVVDRQSRDHSSRILDSHPEVKRVSEPPQSGLGAGYARGWEAASGELLFFCNEDIHLDAECLARLQSAVDLKKNIVAADPWQWDYAGTKLQHAGTRFQKSAWALHSSYPFRNYKFDATLASGGLVPFACAGAFLIHRQAFEAAGGWDTSFFIDNEDVDLFIRLWQQGWQCVTVPGAKVFHDVGGSVKKIIPATRMPVSRMRYRSDWASKVIVAVKYFSTLPLGLNLMNGGLRFLNNLRHGRWKYAGWDFEVGLEVLRRWPQAWAYRREHRQQNTQHPGENFFTHPLFQITA